MKIAYCGYDFFYSCLEKILCTDHQVQRIFTFDCDNKYNFNQYIYQISQTHAIPISQQPISAQTLTQLDDEGCDLIITAGYRHKVPNLSSYKLKGINIHPTLLPVGRGVWPLPWLIFKEQKYGGVTIHKLIPKMDGGDILLQRAFAIDNTENLESLSCKTQILAAEMIVTCLNELDHYWSNAQAQEEMHASWWPMPAPKDRELDWHKSVDELDRISRAFGKFATHAQFDDKLWIVYNIKVWREAHTHTVGRVVHKTNTETVVAASDGYVCLRYFEPAPSMD